MAEKFVPKFTPFTAADVVDRDGIPGWASRIKNASNLSGHALRVGPDLSIQAKSLVNNVWQSIMLPNGGFSFVDEKEAAAALRMITGEDPIPNVVTPPPAGSGS